MQEFSGRCIGEQAQDFYASFQKMREGRRDDVKNTYFFLKRGLRMLYPPLFKKT
jgi:hypothetical protein